MRIVNVTAGSTHKLRFNVTYSEDWSETAKQGNPIAVADITSATFLLKTAATVIDASASVTFTSGASEITFAEGVVTVTMLPAKTTSLSGMYFSTLRLYLAKRL